MMFYESAMFVIVVVYPWWAKAPQQDGMLFPPFRSFIFVMLGHVMALDWPSS